MNANLIARQKAGEEVERQMLEFLLRYSPAEDLTVSNINQIAAVARRLSFEQFSAASEVQS